MAKLKEEHVVTIHVLHQKHTSHAEIARSLGVTEGTVRYHIRRKAAGATDGRAGKPLQLGKRPAKRVPDPPCGAGTA